jgi:DNA-binding SARP family transcriptional activator
MTARKRSAPQSDRLLAKLDRLEAPLIYVWGWPGSGQEAWIADLLAGDPRSRGLAWGELADEEARQAALASVQEARTLLVYGEWRPAEMANFLRWLKPEQRLVVVGGERPVQGAVPSAVIPPQELLLTEAEVAKLILRETGARAGRETVRSLLQATDGWYRPLCLALEATGGAGLAGATAAGLLELPALRLFLRHEVLGALPKEVQARLLDDPEGQGLARAMELGLWVEGESRDRLPALLSALLDRERRRRPRLAAPATPFAPVQGTPVGYRVALLGDPSVHLVQGETLAPVECKLRRSLQILAYLASSPGLSVGREELIEAIWSDASEETIERNFHPTLSYLRRDLETPSVGPVPSPLLYRAGVYRLNPEISWEIDVDRFSRLLEDGRAQQKAGRDEAAAAAFREAWKLYRGPFLAGHYEGWVTARREPFQRQYIEMLRDLGDLSLRLGNPEAATDAYRAVLLEDPLQERVHLAVMRLYAHQGRRDLVRRQYDRLRTLLHEELGVEPLPETSAEFHRLMV